MILGGQEENHDWALFEKTKTGKKTMSATFLPYKLIGDVVYQCTFGFIPH